MSNTGIIYGVNGPVIYLKGDSGFKISEMVYVGPEHLVGEIIGLKTCVWCSDGSDDSDCSFCAAESAESAESAGAASVSL